MPAPDPLEESQRRLFLSLKNELRLLDISTGKEIRSYEKSFRSALPKKVSGSNRKKLLSAIHTAQAVLVGDFHSFRQSQKGFLRLIEDSRHKNPRIAIALECIQQDMQPALDHFCAGLITVEELGEELDFESTWPFSWPNYREILEYARKHGMPLYGLNIKDKSGDPKMLKARDEAAAAAISAALAENPKQKIFVLYGELHLGKTHLPRQVRKRLGSKNKVLVIHQNEISLYWKAPRAEKGHRAEVLRLRRDEYCVLNSVPWVKLRSYIDWLEGANIDEDWQEGLDLYGSISQLSQQLNQVLGLKQKDLKEVEIAGPETLLAPAPLVRGLTSEERKLLRHSIRFQRTTYLPIKGMLLLPSFSTNALSEGASLLIWRSHSAKSRTVSATGSRIIVQFFIAYLGSKILNPKRKCNEVKDMRKLLEGRNSPQNSKKRKVLQRSLEIIQIYLENYPRNKKKLPPLLEIEASRLAGYVLANRLFLALLKNPKLLPFVKKIFSTSNASEAWANHLLDEIQKKISASRIFPHAKSEGY